MNKYLSGRYISFAMKAVSKDRRVCSSCMVSLAMEEQIKNQLLLFGFSTDAPLICFFSLSNLCETVDVRPLAGLTVSGFSFLSAAAPAVVEPDRPLLLLVAAM